VAQVASGHVRDRPFVRTIYRIATKRFTGELTLTEARRDYKVRFHEGTVVAASSPAPADTVGRIAIGAGLVNRTHVGETIRRLAADKSLSQLDVLAEVAKLKPDAVADLRQRHFARQAVRIFALTDATLSLDNEPQLPIEAGTRPLDIRWFIFRGLVTHYNDRRLRQELAVMGDRHFQLSGDAALAPFGFDDVENQVIEHLRPATNLEQFLETVKSVDDKRAMAVVYTLVATNCISAAQAGSAPAERAANPPDAEPVAAEPVAAEPVAAEPDAAEPVAAEPVAAEPVAAEPVAAEPDAAEPDAAEPDANEESDEGAVISSAPPKPDEPATPATPQQPAPVRAPTPVITPTAQGGPPAPTAQPAPARAEPRRALGAVKQRKTNGPRIDPNEVRALVARKAQELHDDLGLFQLLEITADGTAEELRSSYFRLAKYLHPDRLRALGLDDLSDAAQQIFAEINRGFAILSDRGKRSKYTETLAAGGERALRAQQAEAEELAGRLFGAEEAYQLGTMALRRSQFREALAQFQRAVELNPDEAEHHALQAWAMWSAADDKKAIGKEVRRGFRKAISLQPKCVPAYYYRGKIANADGKEETALECFRKVLEYEPNHQGALTEMRVMEGRKSKDKASGGMFRRKR